MSDGLAYGWAGRRPGVWLISDATKPGASRRMVVGNSAGIKGLSGADNPLITLDGSAVIASVGSGTKLAVAEFSVRSGRARRLLIGPVRSAIQYCGPLWTDATGGHQLAACGNGAEYEIQNGHPHQARQPWQLPTYFVPGGPLIAW